MGDCVLLHGFTQTGASWRGVAAQAAERYRLHAPDLRGHGSASDRRPITFAAVVADVLGLTAGPFALAGYSLGGRVALRTALDAPDRVTRLVLVSASPGLADQGERAARRRSDDELAGTIERVPLDDFAQTWSL